MTRSVTIVNTSNWQHEDWLVRQRWVGGEEPGEWEETRIKPGEMKTTMLGSENWEVEVVADTPQEPEPFRLSGKGQALPQVASWVGEAPKLRSG